MAEQLWRTLGSVRDDLWWSLARKATARVAVAMRLLGAVAVFMGAGAGSAPAWASLPPGFVDEPVVSGWNEAAGVTFDANGRAYVWEKGGRVWIVENGVRSAQPMIDLHEEVGDWRDLGLLGFALDPNFLTNGRVYLLYCVDYHHLKYFGTPQYDPNANEYFHDTIARLTRYTANAGDGFRSVDPASRRVLVGETMQTGFPVTHQSHSIGTVAFARDGSLLVGNGDGASYDQVDTGGSRSGSSNTALADGIIKPKEDIGAFRSQLLDSLSGKIIRIDPQTGDGLSDNPFFDPAQPRSARSRVWVLGLRNPFRFTVRPDNDVSHHQPPVGDLYIGDVGWNAREELNHAHEGGTNFGWPLYEGLDPQNQYQSTNVMNPDAPNPLFGIGGCAQPLLSFSSLLAPATLGPGSWPNPCNSGVQIPAGSPRFVHQRPMMDWTWTGMRLGTWSGTSPAWCTVGSPGCLPGGPNLWGRASVGGVFYTGSSFPSDYVGTYFHADWIAGWIHNFILDDEGDVQSVRSFQTSAGTVVCMSVHPITGELWYVAYDYSGATSVRKIRFGGGGVPNAVASASPPFGPLPLSVQFSSAGTTEPDGQALTYTWDFGDNSPVSHDPNPVHQYIAPNDCTGEGTPFSKIQTFAYPYPQGGGNWNINVIADKDFPPVGSIDSWRQYDTFHNADQGAQDYIGYTFPTPRTIRGLIFQEGRHFSDGGWWNTLGVEWFDGSVWRPVTGLASTPLYAGNNGVNFETFTLAFDPVPARGVRLIGEPGGTGKFVSVGELRVLCIPAGPSSRPERFDVTLTVTDPDGNASVARLVVSGNNTPPTITSITPADNTPYAPGGPDLMVNLVANVSDAQTPTNQLSCRWQALLHHSTHSHADEAVNACATTATLTPLGCGEEAYWYEFRFSVTDPQGLSASRSVFMFPACCPGDYNRDSFTNLDDLGDYITDYYTLPAIPGGQQPMAPTYAAIAPGFMAHCPDAPDAPAPYAPDAYRTTGYRVGFSPDGLNRCPLSPTQIFPNLDHLGDYITAYYGGGC
jgi:glucose/arabinose dehydrogenase